MLKKTASFVLASLRGSQRTEQRTPSRLFARCGRAGRPFWPSCGIFWYHSTLCVCAYGMGDTI